MDTKTTEKKKFFIYLGQLQVTARHVFSYQSIQNPPETNGINLEIEATRSPEHLKKVGPIIRLSAKFITFGIKETDSFL